MKIFVMKTEKWKEIDEAIKNVTSILSRFNVSFIVKDIELNLKDKLLYVTQNSNSVSGNKIVTSLNGSIIRNLGEIYGGKDYDGYALMVDKNKSLETNWLYGQHEQRFKTMELYCKKSKKKRFELDYNTENLLHETLHLLAEHHKVKDGLHDYIILKPKNYTAYIDDLFSRINTIKIQDGIELGLKNKKPTNIPKEIIIHHTGGTDTNILADTSHHSFELVKKFHKSKGWQTIGYHYFIEKDGKVWQGRPDDMEGAHCIGKNKTSIGICLAGNFDLTKPTEHQMVSLKAITGHLKAKYGVSQIEGHRKYAKKTCPGKNFTDSMIKAL